MPRAPPHSMPIAAFGASGIIIIITSLVLDHDKPGEDYLCHRNTNVRGFLILSQSFEGPPSLQPCKLLFGYVPLSLGTRPESLPEAIPLLCQTYLG